MKEKLYYLAMIEAFINGKDKTDLGDYTLEYKISPVNKTSRFSKTNDTAFAIFINFRDNKTQEIIWKQIHEKTIVKGAHSLSEESLIEFDRIMSKPYEEKVSFMFDKHNKAFDSSYSSIPARVILPRSARIKVDDIYIKKFQEVLNRLNGMNSVIMKRIGTKNLGN